MSTIRVRPPSDDGRWTYEWYGAYGDGVWMVLLGGRVHHYCYWRLSAWLWCWRRNRK